MGQDSGHRRERVHGASQDTRCKFSVRILHLLGIEGPKAPQPAKFIRYIYNRVVLENAIVRAAAVSSMAKFGINVNDPSMKRSIKVLLSR